MARVKKAKESPMVSYCRASGQQKVAYATRAEAERAAEVATSRTFGEKFVVYKCGAHWHIAHQGGVMQE